MRKPLRFENNCLGIAFGKNILVSFHSWGQSTEAYVKSGEVHVFAEGAQTKGQTRRKVTKKAPTTAI
jgi:hypothetical protein